MKTLIALPLALGMALAAPVSAHAALTHHGVAHHYRATHRRNLAMRAEAPAPALACSVAGCQTESRNIPTLTAEAAMKLPPSQLPTIFRDPTNPYGYPYNIHETDGLSRNPDDCVIWGCVDSN